MRSVPIEKEGQVLVKLDGNQQCSEQGFILTLVQVCALKQDTSSRVSEGLVKWIGIWYRWWLQVNHFGGLEGEGCKGVGIMKE